MGLNPTIVISSPFFRKTFAVRRTTEAVSTHGRSVPTQTVIPNIVGIVTPAGSNMSERKEEATASKKGISIITQFRLYAEAAGQQQDVVLYRGGTYLVETVEDYTGYGPGWVTAFASSLTVQAAQTGVSQ